jgi:hypothetical protein
MKMTCFDSCKKRPVFDWGIFKIDTTASSSYEFVLLFEKIQFLLHKKERKKEEEEEEEERDWMKRF